jgi:hypothetical protein
MRIFGILAVLLLLGCNSDNAFSIQGRLYSYARFGEPFDLKTSSGQVYRIVDLPSPFQQHGLLINATARYRKDASNQSVELSQIRPLSKSVEDWDHMLQSKDRDLLERVDRFRRASGLPLTFWPAENAKPGEEVVTFAWSGCGDLHVSFVKEIPKPGNDRRLEPDIAFELDQTDAIINRWTLPANGLLNGIQGNELLVPYRIYSFVGTSDSATTNDTVYLAVSLDGHFRVLSWNNVYTEPQEIDCPEIKDFAGSAFTKCSIFRDRLTGADRRFAYQRPCT